MSFFKKMGRAITGGFKKVGGALESGANEIGGAFKKSAGVIGRGLGSLAGGGIGSEIGAGIGSVFGPEGTVAGGMVGSIVGKAIGGELGSRAGHEAVKGHNTGLARATKTSPHMSQPPRVPVGLHLPGAIMPKPMVPKLPGPKPQKNIVGRDGGGVYRGPALSVGQKKEMMEKKRNELEKSKPQKKEDLFM
jgi:hypothetical protein